MFPAISGLQTVSRDKSTVSYGTSPNGIDESQEGRLSRSCRFLLQHLLADRGLDTVASNKDVTARPCIVAEVQLYRAVGLS